MDYEEKFKRKYRVSSNRLRNYDYRNPGAYFITICVRNMNKVLGEVLNGEIILTEVGGIAWTCWKDLPNHYNCVLDEYVFMPNHMHGVILISSLAVETGFKPVSTKIHSLSEIIRGFKTFSTRHINSVLGITGKTFWQPRFYDHIIRSDAELNIIREYIRDNPVKWENGEEEDY